MTANNERWRNFICDPSRPGRHLSSILGKGVEAEVATNPLTDSVLDQFLKRLTDSHSDVNLLADAVDLLRPTYLSFCQEQLPILLDRLSNEQVGTDSIVGPGLRGKPHWGRTYLGRRTGRIPPAHYHTSLSTRSFAMPENLLVRWLIESLLGSIRRIEQKVRSGGLPHQIALIRDACKNALRHPWCAEVPPPPKLTQNMVGQANRQRLAAYRSAAALARHRSKREIGSRQARWLAILDLLRVNWLAPVSKDDIFELYALVLVLDVLERELGLGPPVEQGLAIPGRTHVAKFRGEDGEIYVYFDQTPNRVLGCPSRYLATIDAHVGVSGNSRRPDILIVSKSKSGVTNLVIVEVKKTQDRTYISDSIYKVMGYVLDFWDTWGMRDAHPKAILLLPEEVHLKRKCDIQKLDVVVVSSFDRDTLSLALEARLL